MEIGKLEGRTLWVFLFHWPSSLLSVERDVIESLVRGGVRMHRVCVYVFLFVCAPVCVYEPDPDFLHTWQETTKCCQFLSHSESALEPCVRETSSTKWIWKGAFLCGFPQTILIIDKNRKFNVLFVFCEIIIAQSSISDYWKQNIHTSSQMPDTETLTWQSCRKHRCSSRLAHGCGCLRVNASVAAVSWHFFKDPISK